MGKPVRDRQNNTLVPPKGGQKRDLRDKIDRSKRWAPGAISIIKKTGVRSRKITAGIGVRDPHLLLPFKYPRDPRHFTPRAVGIFNPN